VEIADFGLLTGQFTWKLLAVAAAPAGEPRLNLEDLAAEASMRSLLDPELLAKDTMAAGLLHQALQVLEAAELEPLALSGLLVLVASDYLIQLTEPLHFMLAAEAAAGALTQLFMVRLQKAALAELAVVEMAAKVLITALAGLLIPAAEAAAVDTAEPTMQAVQAVPALLSSGISALAAELAELLLRWADTLSTHSQLRDSTPHNLWPTLLKFLTVKSRESFAPTSLSLKNL